MPTNEHPIDWTNVTPANPPANISEEFLYGADGTARNMDSFTVEFTQLSLIAQNRFKWESDKIAPYDRLSEFIEYLLFWYGQCALVKENGTWNVRMCVVCGNPGQFRTPEKFTCRDYNGGNTKVYAYKDIIWIKNNAYCVPTFYLLRHRCDRIAHIERVCDLNLDAQKTPYIIECQPELQFSVKNIFKQIREMWSVVFTNASKGGIRDKIKVLDLNAPYLVDKLYAQKQNEYNDALNLLGIDTIDEKRERLITGETDITSELTDNYIDIFYTTRLTAFREILERVDPNAKLSIMTGYGKKGQDADSQEGDAMNGNVYDTAPQTD